MSVELTAILKKNMGALSVKKGDVLSMKINLQYYLEEIIILFCQNHVIQNFVNMYYNNRERMRKRTEKTKRFPDERHT